MGRVSKCVLIEEEDWNYLQSLGMNLSSEIRDYLKQLRSIKDSDVEGINVELERLKLKKNIVKMEKTQLEIKKSEEILQKHIQIEQKKQEESLKKDKDRIEQLNKCINCKNIIDEDRKVEIKENVFLCKACYHTIDIKKYL